MVRHTRRDFLKMAAGMAGAIAAGSPVLSSAAQKRSATDWVPLGNSGIKVTRLAFGTGTFSGKIQRDLGQEQFTRLVRHAYDSGIRFFETADAYGGMQVMLGTALKGIPRDSYRLMSKYRLRPTDNPRAEIDRQLKELNTEYLDILLLHCVRSAGWFQEQERARDAFAACKEKKIILAHGASCHGLLPLRSFPGTGWLDVALMRVNHNGTLMDNLRDDAREAGDVGEVEGLIGKVHEQGTGVIGMKIIGEGRFKTPEERDASIRFVMKLGSVDAVTIGYKSTAEVDEAIARINVHLNS